MEQQRRRLAATGYLAFLFSGLCAISAGVVVSILKEKYQLSFGMSGTLLSLMSVGNMAASFAAGLLPGKIGTKKTVALLCIGYFVGYLLTAFFSQVGILMGAFLLIGIAKGCAINNCTVLVGNNAADRAKGMSLMHAFYAVGAMVGPFVITALAMINNTMPMLGLALGGLVMWLIFMAAGLDNKPAKKADGKTTDFSFLKDLRFWLLTGLIFFQNSAETAVTGWLVTYYKDSAILSGTLSTYTVTIMWGATLAARLLIAFVFPIKNTFKALAIMGAGCVVLYFGLVSAVTPVMAIVMLAGFAFAMAGVNPVGMAGVGKQMNATTVGVLIPLAALGQIVMPWIIGIAADGIGLQAAMWLNLIPCVGIVVMSIWIMMLDKKKGI
ncbi:MAG: MFS transporter [Clostridia bacterium]|nr:MFS transporter [Clostridia bacterium]